MAAKGMTREGWLEWLKTKWVPYLKKIHITDQERRSLIDRYIKTLMNELGGWTFNAVIKICNPNHCIALIVGNRS